MSDLSLSLYLHISNRPYAFVIVLGDPSYTPDAAVFYSALGFQK